MKYLSEIRKNLPENCLFDKGKVGCGGTTLALENDEPYVVCVPFQSLIENKIKQYPEGKIIGVMEGVGIMDIKYYLREVKIPKIMVTYDSLPKVLSCINPQEFNLLIDEYHILLTQYAFRSEAINNVLNNFKLFKKWCFMTATPIEEEFILDELKDIPIVRQSWNDVLNTKVITVKCDSVKASTIKLIKSHLSGKIEGNAYLFVNSTKFIKDLINTLKLNSENTRVIYSKGNKIQLGIERGSTLDAPKKINFLTSTAFEGSDIYDEEGKIYVISDNTYTHTLLDISTSIQQISGRIRNSKYINTICHLFNTSRYNGLSYKEFKENQDELERTALKIIKTYNSLDEIARKDIISNNIYIYKSSDNYFNLDHNMMLVDSFNYNILNTYQVRVNLTDAYCKQSFEITTQQDIIKIKNLNLNNTESKTFKDIILELRKEKENKYSLKYDELLQQYSYDYPFLKEAINKLGFEKIETLRYVQKDIKDALIKIDNLSLDVKVTKRLNLKTGDFISKADCKKKLTDLFSILEIKEKPSASDITKWYDVKENRLTIKGKRVEGYTIIRPKFRI
jgi:hypothetical protein